MALLPHRSICAGFQSVRQMCKFQNSSCGLKLPLWRPVTQQSCLNWSTVLDQSQRYEKGEVKEKSVLMDFLQGRLGRHLSVLIQVEASLALESGLALGGLREVSFWFNSSLVSALLYLRSPCWFYPVCLKGERIQRYTLRMIIIFQ